MAEAYLHKNEKVATEEILWNVPERPTGVVAVVGGNAQSFRTPVSVTEFLAANYPVQEVRLVLPESLQGKIPAPENTVWVAATETGAMADGERLAEAVNAADYGVVVGDLSKNSITGKAVASACVSSDKPLLVTRDAVDLAAENQAERWLMNQNVVLFASMPQLMKIFRAVYYPKMLMLTQPLVQVAEALHKFTLSYPVSLITLHDGQILIVRNGLVEVLPLAETPYSPLTIWSGEAAARVAALNLYNPNKFAQATLTAFVQA